MTPLEQASAILKVAEEIVALKAIAGPGDLSTAQIKPTSEGEWVECPACNGDGMVDAETYVNFDDKPLTVQFYGIGECFGNYQNLFDTAIKHAPAIALALIEKHRALEDAEARLAQLESILAEAREALGPFKVAGADWFEMGDTRRINEMFVTREGYPITVGDLRRAATVSAKIDEMDAALKEDGK